MRYQTEKIPVSPVHQHCVPQEMSSSRNCLVSPTDVRPVPLPFFLTSPFSCTAIEYSSAQCWGLQVALDIQTQMLVVCVACINCKVRGSFVGAKRGMTLQQVYACAVCLFPLKQISYTYICFKNSDNPMPVRIFRLNFIFACNSGA